MKKGVSIFNRISFIIFQMFRVVQIAMERGSFPCSKFYGSAPVPKIWVEVPASVGSLKYWVGSGNSVPSWTWAAEPSTKIMLMNFLLQHKAAPEGPHRQPGKQICIQLDCSWPEWTCTREELLLSLSIPSLDHQEGGVEQQRLKTRMPTLELSH